MPRSLAAGHRTHMSLTDAINKCHLPSLIRKHCPQANLHALREKGGTICDPRPEHKDAHPSFSLWVNDKGVWMWKKRGSNPGVGNAYTFLTSLGLSGPQARLELLDFTSTASTWSERQRQAATLNLLEEARKKLTELRPATTRQVNELLTRCQPIRLQDRAGQELQRRGLWPPADLNVASLAGELVMILRHPTGRIMNLKKRLSDEHGRGKYILLFPGIGTPPWVNPGYGQRRRVMLIEGELNAAAAWRVIQAEGLDFDVQGLPGTDTWPYLQGLDREVWIYADADQSGQDMRARIQDLAYLAGASKVHQIPSLPKGQDFCDVLGRQGVTALNAALHAQQIGETRDRDTALEPPAFTQGRPTRQGTLLGEINCDPHWPLSRSRRALRPAGPLTQESTTDHERREGHFVKTGT